MPEAVRYRNLGALNFERLLAFVPAPIMVLDQGLKFSFVNIAYCKSTKSSPEELLGRYVFEAFPDTEERIAPILSKFKASLKGETTFLEEVPFQLEGHDGTIEDRVWRATQTPLKDEAGTVTHMIQHCDDITESVALRQQKEVISAELDHRVRNLMTVVQSVATLASGRSDTLEDFLSSFSGRLESIARNFSAISQSDWTGLYLDDILRTELFVFVDPKSRSVVLEGPRVKLTLAATKDLSLIIHELVTNAIKYGFLSDRNGKLNVNWSTVGDVLHLEWAETGLTGISAPSQLGFGFGLLDLIPNSEVYREFEDEGLRLRAKLAGAVSWSSAESRA